MSNKLPKSTKDRIYADASKWSEMQYGHDDVNKDYLEGALHEAGLAQAAEQRADRYEKALKEIVSPIAYLQRKANEEGAGIDGHYAQELANTASFLQGIASEALTPKPTTDDTVNG